MPLGREDFYKLREISFAFIPFSPFFLFFFFFVFNHTGNLTLLVCVLQFFYVPCKATKHCRRSGTYKNLDGTHVLFFSANSFPAAETRFEKNKASLHTFEGVIRKNEATVENCFYVHRKLFRYSLCV